MRYQGFIGGSYQGRSLIPNSERTVNFFPELLQPGTPKSPIALHGTPGYRVFGQTGGVAPVRALFHQDGRAFAVAGSAFYELTSAGAMTNRGVLASDTNPATISSNGVGGNQLFITAGGKGYVFNLKENTLSAITSEGFPEPVLMGAFSDGYFFALEGGDAARFFLSSLEDGTTWDALDVAQPSASSNALRAFAIDHRELHLFGQHTIEVWYNSGEAGFPFTPIQGVFVENGILAPWSVAKLDNMIYWLGRNERGGGVLWKMQGYTPQRVSTHAVEFRLAQYPRLAEAIAWVYEDEGHAFYLLYVPDSDVTWVYDVAIGLWHERAVWDTRYSVFRPDVGRCHCYAFGKHLVGDRQSGTVYDMDLDYYDAQLVVGTGF
jgi:hypothetical protein